MKKIILILIFGILLCQYSCYPEDTETSDLVFINSSDHKIHVGGYLGQDVKMDIKILPSETENFRQTHLPGDIWVSINTLIVTYDDSIAVKHGYPLPEPNLNRNLFSKSSYHVASIGKNERRYEYTFTNEDYEEALMLMTE